MNSSGTSLVHYAQNTVLVVTTLCIGIGGSLAIAGTSSGGPDHFLKNNIIFSGSITSAGSGEIPLLKDSILAENGAISTSQALSEVRMISGLTWDEIGKLFHVSRRSVHFWASGKPMNSMNEKFLMKVLDFFRRVDRGNARGNRAVIFQPHDGRIPFDLISEKNFTGAEQLLGRGVGRKESIPSRIDYDERILRSPLPPEQLVDAMNDRIHRPSGKGRAVRTMRARRREIG